MDITLLRERIMSLFADLEFFDDLTKKKHSFTTNLWAVKEQMKFENNADNPDMLALLEDRAKQLEGQIENCTLMMEKVREKMLRAIGKL